MQKSFSFLAYIIPFTVVLFLTQNYLINSVFNQIPFFYSTWIIYLFHVLITIGSYLFLLFVNKTFPDNTGFAFMGFSLVKMMAAVVFLLPLLQSEVKSQIPDVAAFFIPYFLYLFFETFFAIRLINKH